MMSLGACPHCGYNRGIYQKMYTTGRAAQEWNDYGRLLGVLRIREKFTPHSDAVRCGACHHIRRDWMAVDGELVRGE
jgi:hypothetical protein